MNGAKLEILRQDHAHLRAVLERVDAFLVRRASALATRRTVAAFTDEPSAGASPLALELAARLGTHLTTESDAECLLRGLLDRDGAADAASRGAMGALRGEHDELRSMLAALVRTLDGAAGARRDEQLAVQLRDLVDLVRIHVRKEDVLILAASQTTMQPLRRRKGNPS